MLQDFLSGDVPTEVILADHNLTPDQFLAWIESAETQHKLETIAKIDAARAKAIAATSRADALFSLRRVLMQSKSLGEIRRAASAILRYDAVANKPAAASKPATDPTGIVPDPRSELPTSDFHLPTSPPLTSPPAHPPIPAGGTARAAREPDPVPVAPAA